MDLCQLINRAVTRSRFSRLYNHIERSREGFTRIINDQDSLLTPNLRIFGKLGCYIGSCNDDSAGHRRTICWRLGALIGHFALPSNGQRGSPGDNLICVTAADQRAKAVSKVNRPYTFNNTEKSRINRHQTTAY